MMTATTRNLLRWLGWAACALWLGYGIYHEVLSQDPSHFGFRALSFTAS